MPEKQGAESRFDPQTGLHFSVNARTSHGWHGNTTDEKYSALPIRGIAMPSVGGGVSDNADVPRGPPFLGVFRDLA